MTELNIFQNDISKHTITTLDGNEIGQISLVNAI